LYAVDKAALYSEEGQALADTADVQGVCVSFAELRADNLSKLRSVNDANNFSLLLIRSQSVHKVTVCMTSLLYRICV
jgi:hypothetical protein